MCNLSHLLNGMNKMALNSFFTLQRFHLQPFMKPPP